MATLLDELGDSLAGLTQTESQDDWVEYGDAVLQATNKLVSTLVEPTMTENTRNLTTNHTGYYTRTPGTLPPHTQVTIREHLEP